jgi:hypothetical protein
VLLASTSCQLASLSLGADLALFESTACLLAPGAFTYYPQADIKDAGDFSCNLRDRQGRPQDFCFEFGPISTVAGSCLLNSGCKAFVTAERDGRSGGYLKNVTHPRSFVVNTDLYVRTTT